MLDSVVLGVCRDTQFRDRRVCRVRWDLPVLWARWVLRARTEDLVQPVLPALRVLPDSRVLLDSPACQALRARLARWVLTASTERRGLPEPWDRTAWLVFRVLKVWQEAQVSLVSLVPPVSTAFPAPRVRRVSVVRPGPTARVVCQDRTARQEPLDRLALLGVRGLLAQLALRGPRVHTDRGMGITTKSYCFTFLRIYVVARLIRLGRCSQ